MYLQMPTHTPHHTNKYEHKNCVLWMNRLEFKNIQLAKSVAPGKITFCTLFRLHFHMLFYDKSGGFDVSL